MTTTFSLRPAEERYLPLSKAEKAEITLSIIEKILESIKGFVPVYAVRVGIGLILSVTSAIHKKIIEKYALKPFKVSIVTYEISRKKVRGIIEAELKELSSESSS